MIDRRHFVGGSIALALASMLERAAFAETAKAPKAVILLWMNGGPSHIDTWDPKKGAVAGPGKSIATTVPGVSISEHLPELARMAGKLAIIRGMTSKEGNHQRAQYFLRTGYAPTPTVNHPTLAAWASKRFGAPGSGLPASVSLGGPSLGGGFFGVQHGPFVVQTPGTLPQNSENGPFTDDARFAARTRLLGAMEQGFADRTGDTHVAGRRALYDDAYRLMHASALAAFDAGKEPEATRQAFGDTPFGRGCLTAVRLIASGVRFVEVTLDGWDTHQDNFEKTKKLMATLDPAMSALLRELHARGLEDKTVVMWMGDFGRTPKINGRDGRDHHPAAWSAVLTGGGLRTGFVHGETDAEGDRVVKDGVTVPDLLATVAKTVGLDPEDTAVSPAGRPISLTNHGRPLAVLTG